MSARLLLVADDFVAGGAFMVGVRLARGLAQTYRVVFACDFSPVNRAARGELAEAGVEVLSLFAHAGETRRARYDRGGACALLSRSNPDKIVFVDSSPRSNLAAKDVAREAGAPYVCVINFVDRETPAALKQFDADVERTANAAAAIVFVSAAARAEFEANFPGVAAPRFVIGNGVPDAFFADIAAQARRALRGRLGIGEEEVALLLPGRLEPRKGQHLALEALAALGQRAGPPIRLFIAGFGDEAATQALEARIRALSLETRVRYLGLRDDLPQLMDACDIVLLPSEQEADPLVLKEAMARGRPAIASDLPGVREQGHPEALRVPAPGEAPQRTVEALVGAIDALSHDPARRAEIGRSLRALAERRFAMAQMIEAYRAIIETLPARHRSGEPPALELGRWLAAPQQAGLFKDGWADLEPEGLWSEGPRSRIAFALPRASRRVKVTLKAWTFAPPGRERTFEAFANGRKVATWTFANQKRMDLTVRLSLPVARRLIVLRLLNADPSSPHQLGLNEDRRPLGMFVFALRVDVGGALGRLWRGLRS